MTNFFASGLPLTKKAELLQSKFHLLSETSVSFETLSVLSPQISHMALCILQKGQIAVLESWNEPPSITENKQLLRQKLSSASLEVTWHLSGAHREACNFPSSSPVPNALQTGLRSESSLRIPLLPTEKSHAQITYCMWDYVSSLSL